ncbi:MAG: 1-acyl-sn-glycerol-3-phosphate acyltransferase [Bacilli bacterium]
MFFLITLFIGMIFSFIYIYNTQYLSDGIIWWSIPIIVIVMSLLVFITVALILYIVTLFIKPDKRLTRPRSFNQFMTKIMAELLVGFFGIKIIYQGFEKIPQNEKFLLIGNHQSNYDPITYVWAFRKYSIAFIMKNNIMRVPLLGRWLYGAGFLPIDRHNDRKAVATISCATKRIENGIQNISVYPEGTRSKGPHMNEFRNGVFRIALKSKSPIVVSVLDNVYRVKYRFPFRKTKVVLDIVKVLEYEDYKHLSTNELGDMIHDLMTNRLKELRETIPYLKLKQPS